MATRSGIAVACALSMSLAARAQTPGIHFTGIVQDGNASFATAVSSDGRYVAGFSRGVTRNPGFTWSEQAGRYDLGMEPSFPGNSQPYGISEDGTTVVGIAGTRAYRWTGPGTYQSLGVLPVGPDARSTATGVSGDGAVVAGFSAVPSGFTGQAFRWTPATGMQGLGFTRPGHSYSEAAGISRDGSTIVGYSESVSGFTDAFAWTQAGGMQILPPLPLGSGSMANAYGVNHNGTIAVGDSQAAGFNSSAVLWTNGIVQNLGFPVGWTGSRAIDVTDDGNMAFGFVYTPFDDEFAIWTPSNGWTLLPEYLAAQGLAIPENWTLYDMSMSSDGRTFVGTVSEIGSFPEGIVITVPAPGVLGTLLFGCVIWVPRRR